MDWSSRQVVSEAPGLSPQFQQFSCRDFHGHRSSHLASSTSSVINHLRGPSSLSGEEPPPLGVDRTGLGRAGCYQTSRGLLFVRFPRPIHTAPLLPVMCIITSRILS